MFSQATVAFVFRRSFIRTGNWRRYNWLYEPWPLFVHNVFAQSLDMHVQVLTAQCWMYRTPVRNHCTLQLAALSQHPNQCYLLYFPILIPGNASVPERDSEIIVLDRFGIIDMYRTSWWTIYYQSFIYSPTHALVVLKNSIKIYIKTAPTCFDVTVRPSSGSALVCAYYRRTVQHTDTNKDIIYAATPPPY